MSVTSDYYGTREVARQVFASLQCSIEPTQTEYGFTFGSYFIAVDANIVARQIWANDTEAVHWFNEWLNQ